MLDERSSPALCAACRTVWTLPPPFSAAEPSSGQSTAGNPCERSGSCRSAVAKGIKKERKEIKTGKKYDFVRDIFQKGIRSYWITGVCWTAGGVQVFNDLLQVLGHPLQLGVHVLSQLVRSLTLLVGVLHVDGSTLLLHSLFQRAKQVLQLLLLGQDEIQLLVEPSLIQLHLLHLLV